jgi:hypothetical protein
MDLHWQEPDVQEGGGLKKYTTKKHMMMLRKKVLVLLQCIVDQGFYLSWCFAE